MQEWRDQAMIARLPYFVMGALSPNLQVKDLQERVWSQTRKQRNNSSDSIRSGDSMKSSSGHRSTGDSAWGKHASPEFSSYLSLLPSAASNDKVDQQVQCMMKEVGDGQAREEHLHTLLREKDAALHSLQYSLSTQITAKNHELEELTGKVTFLKGSAGITTLWSGSECSYWQHNNRSWAPCCRTARAILTLWTIPHIGFRGNVIISFGYHTFLDLVLKIQLNLVFEELSEKVSRC
nr:uncharacterized protein LOC128695716 [Cherax quadricarinatus]